MIQNDPSTPAPTHFPSTVTQKSGPLVLGGWHDGIQTHQVHLHAAQVEVLRRARRQIKCWKDKPPCTHQPRVSWPTSIRPKKTLCKWQVEACRCPSGEGKPHCERNMFISWLLWLEFVYPCLGHMSRPESGAANAHALELHQIDGRSSDPMVTLGSGCWHCKL